MLPPDGYIHMYMPHAFKNILHFLHYCFLAKRIAAMTYRVNQVKKVRNILTRVQLSVFHEGPCSTEPVNTFKKERKALSRIPNKAGDALGMGKKLHNAE